MCPYVRERTAAIRRRADVGPWRRPYGKGVRETTRAPALSDVALAAGVVVFLAAVSPQIDRETGDRAIDALGLAVFGVAGGALAFRRRWPLPVVVTVTAAVSVYLMREYAGGPVYVTVLVALYSLATTWERRSAFVVAAAASAWLIGLGLALDTGAGLAHLVFAGWAAASVFLGDSVRSRRQQRSDDIGRRVAEERLRIARDLHDSVAHSMTAINVQAGTAAHVMDRQPERAREALLIIQEQSKTVLEELGALLGVLRDPGESATRTPSPGLDDLDDLVTTTRAAGVDVRLERDLPTEDVPTAVALAAYRIVQESLTNVVRHAGPGASAVVIVSNNGSDHLAIEVSDDGGGTPAPSRPTAGVGITGMRERAEATGGTLTIGPRTDGPGFRVHAYWPARQ